MDPVMPILVAALLSILMLSLFLRYLGQPSVVGYLLAGVALGPDGLHLISDHALLERLGSFGVVLLLFFIGMEMNLKRLTTQWRIALIGTILQVGISVALVWILGWYLDWPLARIVLIGFVISLSSTAVILSLLQSRGELESRAGQNALVILLMQDLAVIPMMLLIGMFSGAESSAGELAFQAIGTLLIVLLCVWIFFHESIDLPWLHRMIGEDHEIQVFVALILCLGLALLTGMLSLSSALGAFVAGMFVATVKEMKWVHHSLEPFRVVFVALFFVSIGMLVSLDYLWSHLIQTISLVVLALATNTFINAAVLRLLGETWSESLYVGALLAQIGEFSFVLVAVGYGSAIITLEGYQLAISVIALTLLFAPLWIKFMTRIQSATRA